MLVIDQLVSVKNKTSVAMVEITEGHLFLDEDGMLEETIYIEMIAQSIGAGVGYEDSLEGGGQKKGLLLAAKDLEIFGRARVGDNLRIAVRKLFDLGGVCIVEGEVHQGEVLLARGEIKVFQMSSEEDA